MPVSGITFILLGIASQLGLGKLSITRYHGKRRVFKGIGGLLAGYAIWPAKYDSLAVALSSASMVLLGVAVLIPSVISFLN